MHFRSPIDKVLAVEHKYRHSLSIEARNNYKIKEQQNPKVHINTHPKITPSHFLFKQTFSFSNLSIRVFLTNTTPVCSIPFQSFLASLHRRHDQSQHRPSIETRISTGDFSHHQLGYEETIYQMNLQFIFFYLLRTMDKFVIKPYRPQNLSPT